MPKYSAVLMDHFESPRNSARMESPDLVGLAGTPGRGQFLAIYLRVKDGVVVEASYQCHGCGVTIAVGSMLTELIRNQPVVQCLAITLEELTTALDGVPPHKNHCPAMAITALQNAFEQRRQETAS